MNGWFVSTKRGGGGIVPQNRCFSASLQAQPAPPPHPGPW